MTHWILAKDQVAQTRVIPNSEAKFETECHDLKDEVETISDDDICGESDADDKVIAVMSGDDSETVNDVEDEEQNIDDLSNEENNTVWEKACKVCSFWSCAFLAYCYSKHTFARESTFFMLPRNNNF